MMAPDIDSLSSYKTDGYADNGVPRSPSYQIPDIVLNSPATRKIRVLSIGAGVSGVMNAYEIQKHCENVEHVIYEKNDNIGGTWLENRYPGCGCVRRVLVFHMTILTGSRMYQVMHTPTALL
jgi:hydroxyversicolorone monooxygenase